ncbi:MAG: AMP-binding protein [Pseudomonadota bacterium]
MHDVYTQKPWLNHYDPNVPSALSYEDKTFAEVFQDVVRRSPDKTALIYLGSHLNFRELDELSNQLAHFFIQSGLKPNDVVGLHLPNIPAHYIAVIAAQKAGCVTSGLSPLMTPAEMAHQLQDSQAKMVITVDVLFAKLAQVATECPFATILVSEIADFLPPLKRFLGKLLKKIPTAEVTPIPGKNIRRFTEILPTFSKEFVPVKRTMDDMIFMMYTGGTTGLAKGAMLTQRNYMYNRRQVLTWLDIKTEDTALSAFPMFHIAGLALGGFIITQGATQVCVPNPRDSHFLIEAIKKYRPTCIVNVPTVYFEMMKKPEFKTVDLSGVKWCLSAAAPFPAENIKELEAIIGEGNFIELYGMTETSPVTCCNPRYGKKKASSIGMPLSDTEFKLIDPASREPVKPGEPGEIAIRGPQVMKGYFGQPGETANVLRDGWLYTGDIARMDDDGYFYIVDRLKDMVIVSGFKVFTRELDDVLSRHPDVQMAASVGLPDPERPGSERVACAITLRPGIEDSAAEKEIILKYLKENVAPYKVPKVITFMDQLPTSGVGKILKRELKQILAEQPSHNGRA